MKKLLSLLTISTLTASVPAPLLANTTSTGPTKINIPLPALDDDIELKLNNDYLPIKKINGVNDKVQSISVDSKTMSILEWVKVVPMCWNKVQTRQPK